MTRSRTIKADRPRKAADIWRSVGPGLLPFADAASDTLPMRRLVRLSLFQVSIGLAMVLLNATLNRVMIVELGVPAGLVALMIAIPILFAPARILIGHRSDHHRSHIGWRRVPYMWIGTMLLHGGLAIMPFALLVLTRDAASAPVWVGHAGAALAFLLVGAGLHTVQTTGLALASDLSPAEKLPRVIAFLYVMLLLGMGVSALVLGHFLAEFSQVRLIQVIQGAAVVAILLNFIALWKQEGRKRGHAARSTERPSLRASWADYSANGGTMRLMVAVALGSAAFAMQEVLLEPYGGEILGLSVASTTTLTAILAAGTLCGFMLAGLQLGRGASACQIAAFGALVGLIAFPVIIASDSFSSPALFRTGSLLIGFGTGLFMIGSLTAAMDLAKQDGRGLALGAWGAVHATATGGAIALGGVVRDFVSGMALTGRIGPAAQAASTGYVTVYLIEIVLIFATLVAIGPLVRHGRIPRSGEGSAIGMARFPG